MDYSKIPLAKRTRLQTDLFFREYNEKKRAKSGAGGDSVGGSGGNRGTGGEARADGGGANVGYGGAGDSGSVAGSGSGTVVGGRGEAYGLKTKSMSKNVVPIRGESKKIIDKKGSEKYKNVADASVDSKRKPKSSKSQGVKKNKNKNVVPIHGDSKKILGNKKGMKKYKNVGIASVDYASEDEIQFLGMKDKNGMVVEVDEVDSICSILVKDSDSEEVKSREEIISPCRKRKKSAGVKINNGKSCGVPSQARSGLGVSKKGNEVIDDSSIDSENSDELSESQHVSESHSTESIDSSDSEDLEESESSIEKDSDRSSDEDYEVDNPSCPSNSYDSSSSSEEEYEDEDGKEGNGNVKDDGKEKGVEDGLKRGRGRPRKAVNGKERHGNVKDDGNETGVEDGLKRGRGRPGQVVNGKERNGNIEDDGKETGVEEGLKRGRGRPRKVGGGSGSVDGDGKERSAEGLLKRKKFCGWDIWVDSEKEVGKIETEGPKSVAERLRSRQCVSKSRKSKKKKQELGTFSCPLTLTDEELDYSSGDEDENDGDGNTSFKNGNEGKYVQKDGEKDEKGEKGKGKVVRPAKRSRNGVDSATPTSVDKILADSIWEKGDVPLENLVSSGDKVLDVETTLPLKFRFEDDDPKPPDKSYWDIEADTLFAEMDFVLAACEIGSLDSSMVNNKDSFTLETETDPATCCRQGKHQLVLDEEIGLRCKFCSFVSLEIKHILPSFSKHPWGRLDKKVLASTDHFNLDKLQFQDSASVYQCGSKRNLHAEGTVWDILPGIKESMFPHQRDGFEFIWKNIAGGIDIEGLKKRAFEGGSGCIISHAPGTGKTRLTIMFLQTYMELNRTCRPVIIAPSSMLLTWEEEFRKWKVDIPFHNLNQLEFSGRENVAAVNLLRQVGHQGQKNNSIRMVKLYSWKKERSILGISYSLFEKLTGDGVLADGGSKQKKQAEHYAEGEQVRKMLLELPGLLVLDEGHTPRNDQSLIWKALSRVVTQRRIILSGTPFQNNFGELFNTLCLVRPKFADRNISESEGGSGRKRRRESSAARGKWVSLTSSIGKDAHDRLDELRAMIDPFVHVHKGTILEESLPGLRDSLIVLRPTALQRALIEVIQGRKNPFELDYLVSLISVHPSLLLGRCLSEKEKLSVDADKLKKLSSDPEAGIKTKFLMELIRLCEALREKVLVFSQYTKPLKFIRKVLKSHFDWTEGKEVLYMDGKVDAKHRQCSISLLNDPASEVRVLLASTKACSEGINLVGASRVVLLDVVWNPSVERQAISRAYRLGQKKVVYIYYLITSGTMEGEKYVRQAEKERLSELVFSSRDGGVHKPEISCTVTEDMILQEMVQHEKISNMFEKILNQPKASNLIDTFG